MERSAMSLKYVHFAISFALLSQGMFIPRRKCYNENPLNNNLIEFEMKAKCNSICVSGIFLCSKGFD